MQQHICYHIISDSNNKFLNALQEVKTTVDEWKIAGDTHIKVYRIMTEELGSDAINLEEEELSIDELIIS